MTCPAPPRTQSPIDDHYHQRAMTITVVLLDLDGVIRHFDPEFRPSIERTHGLPDGILQATAFEDGLITATTTGRLTRAAWTEEIGRRIGNPEAAAEWLANRGHIDNELMAEVDRLRANGIIVAVLTNGTDTVDQELVDHGVFDRFDAVYNSWAIGHIKPDPRAFTHVLDELAVTGDQVFFTDDSEKKLAGAVEVGMTARRYRGVDEFRQHLAELGLR